jgi:NADPH:quinone reductase-like Zn-dependent oxidoreductase
MRAITYSEYGSPDVLRVAESARPLPRDDEVLLKIRAASVNPLDWHYMRGTPYLIRISAGIRRPKKRRLGVDVSGQVEAVGKNVMQFQPGDEVFGTCKGAFAEYACASERTLAPKPVNLTFEHTAAVPIAALTALQSLRDRGRIKPEQTVLINGASGGVGTFAVQIARTFGAEVAGVCSTRNVDMVRSIGAHHVVDYMSEDFTKSGQKYDLILDCVGSHSLSDTRKALTDKGTLVLVGGPDEGRWIGPLVGVFEAFVVSLFVSQKVLPFLAHVSKDDLLVLRKLLEDGSVKPIIDRTHPLDEVPAALRYLEDGHARGKVVITV